MSRLAGTDEVDPQNGAYPLTPALSPLGGEGANPHAPENPLRTPPPPASRQAEEEGPVACCHFGSETRFESRLPEGKRPQPTRLAEKDGVEGLASGRGRAALLILTLLLAGCGGGAKKPASTPAKPKEEPAKSVATGAVEIVQKEVVGEEKAPGAVAWRVAGKRSQITFAEGKATGMLYEVEGTLFGEKTETKFTARQGKVDQRSDSLELTGDITATASDGGVLRADKLIWLKERGLVRALGHVRYSGGGYQAGEFEELLATSDLKKMGTPDMFPSTMELKKKK